MSYDDTYFNEMKKFEWNLEQTEIQPSETPLSTIGRIRLCDSVYQSLLPICEWELYNRILHLENPNLTMNNCRLLGRSKRAFKPFSPMNYFTWRLEVAECYGGPNKRSASLFQMEGFYP